MKNNYWTAFFLIGGTVNIVKTNTKPTHPRILEMASLIVGPNNISPLKDRFGIFNPNLFSDDTLSEDQILKIVEQCLPKLT